MTFWLGELKLQFVGAPDEPRPRGVWMDIDSPPKVDRIWGIWGSYCNIPKAIFYLLKEDYRW